MRMITKSVDLSYKTLEVGGVYSYKKLCEILNEKPKTGNSKPSQIERWNNYFQLEKISRSDYKVISIIDNPPDEVNPYKGKALECEQEFNDALFFSLLTQDSYYNNHTMTGKYTIFRPHRIITEDEDGNRDTNLHLVSKYNPDMEEMSDCVRDAFYFDKNELIKTMGLYDRSINFKSTYEDIRDTVAIQLFKDVVTGKAREVFDYRIKKLEKQGFLKYKDCIVYTQQHEDKSTYTKQILSLDRSFVLPDSYTDIWKECEKQALQDLEYRSIQGVIVNDSWSEYLEVTKALAIERDDIFANCEKKKLIILNPDKVDDLRRKYTDKYDGAFDKKWIKRTKECDVSVRKVREMMCRLCKERIKRRIAKSNQEYEESKVQKEKLKKVIAETKEMGWEYPELEKELADLDKNFQHKYTAEIAMELLTLCNKLYDNVEDVTKDIPMEDEEFLLF